MTPISINAISRPRTTSRPRIQGCASGKTCQPVDGMIFSLAPPHTARVSGANRVARPIHNSDYTHGTAAPEGSPGNSRCRARDWECARRAPGPGHDCGAHRRAPSSDGDVPGPQLPAHTARCPVKCASAPAAKAAPRLAAVEDDSEREGHRDGHARLHALKPRTAECQARPGREDRSGPPGPRGRRRVCVSSAPNPALGARLKTPRPRAERGSSQTGS